MIPFDLNSLLGHLTSKGIKADLQTETNQILILFKINDREFPLFIRIFEGGELLQLLAFIPCNLKKSAYSDTSRLLHLLNKELDIPGFGLDEDSSMIYYRCMLPVLNEQIEESLLEAYIKSIELLCKSFSPVIASVAFGNISFDEVVKKTREQNQNQSFAQSQMRHQ